MLISLLHTISAVHCIPFNLHHRPTGAPESRIRGAKTDFHGAFNAWYADFSDIKKGHSQLKILYSALSS